jgi:hypothetical protein
MFRTGPIGQSARSDKDARRHTGRFERRRLYPGLYETKLVRDVPAAVKRDAYAEYGRSKEKGKCCEVDHLIPLELGGSNRLKNLWPEPYDTEWSAKVKDRLENRLHAMVCAGDIELSAAQKAIATDWIRAYKEYVGETPYLKRARHRH